MKIKQIFLILIISFIAFSNNAYADSYFETKTGYGLTKNEYENTSEIFE